MMRRARFSKVVFLATAFLALFAGFCLAAPIDAIPDDAIVVVRVRSPKGLAKKAATFATKVDKEYEESFTELASTIGAYFSNPKVEGNVGDWWLAVIPGSGAQNAVVMGIPFKDKKDEDKVKAAIGGNFKFEKHEKYLFYTQDGSAVQQIKDRIDKKGKSISTIIDRVSMPILMQSDVGVFVNVKQLAERYKPTIDSVSDELNKGFADWKNLAPNVEGTDLAPLFKMYGDAAKTALQTVRDAEGYAAGIELTAKGVTIEQQLKLKSGSPTDKLLLSHTTSDLKELDKLPGGQLVYGAFHGDLSALTQWSYKFTAELLKDEPSRKTMREVADGHSELKYEGYLFSFATGENPEEGMHTTLVTIAEPIDKLREITRKSAALLTGMSMQGVNQKVELKPDAEKIGTRSADVMSVSVEASGNPAGGPADIAQKATAAMYGPDGPTQRMVYLGDRVIVTTGGGKPAMEQAVIAQERSRPTSDKSAIPLTTTRKELAEKANIILLADVPSLVVAFAKLAFQTQQATGIESPGIDITPMKDLETKPSYLGVSVTIGAASVASKTYIPIEQVQGLNTLFKPYLPLLQMIIPR